jgi:hypothetical protein
MEGLKDAVGIIFTVAVVVGFLIVFISFSRNRNDRKATDGDLAKKI